jgi:hypothetical protein
MVGRSGRREEAWTEQRRVREEKEGSADSE